MFHAYMHTKRIYQSSDLGLGVHQWCGIVVYVLHKRPSRRESRHPKIHSALHRVLANDTFSNKTTFSKAAYHRKQKEISFHTINN